MFIIYIMNVIREIFINLSEIEVEVVSCLCMLAYQTSGITHASSGG